MILGPLAQILAFTLLSLIAILGALGMATTMSMYRSGIFLMGSFIGVSGLFILLSADLLGLLQIMMYIGGMLVMILFMALFSHDPGGDMMAGMDLPLVEKFFSLGLLPKDEEEVEAAEVKSPGEQGEEHQHHEMNHGEDEAHGHGGMDHSEAEHGEHDGGDSGHDHNDMDHSDMDHDHMDHGDMDMSMVTPVRPYAAALGIVITVLLVGLLLFRPAWPVIEATPDPNSAQQIGSLLMGKYMMAFEGAGLLILVGIFGAVYIARPDRHPSPKGREAYVGLDEDPTELEDDRLVPLMEIAEDSSNQKQSQEVAE